VQVIDLSGFRLCPPFGHFVESRFPPRFRAVKPSLFHKVIHRVCGYPENPFIFGDLAQLVRKTFEVVAKRAQPFYDRFVDFECKMHLRKLTGQMYS
jgi:hypothetical protein